MDKKQTTKKRGRRKYLDDYKLVGKSFVYTGDWFVFNGTDKQLRRYNMGMTALSVLGFACMLAIGFLPVRSLYRFYVLLPYVLSLMISVMCLIDAVKVWNAGGRLNRKQYERGAKRIEKTSLALFAAATLAVLGEAGYLIFVGRQQGLLSELSFLAGALICAVSSFLMHRLARSAGWKKSK